MPIESLQLKIEKEKNEDDSQDLVERLRDIRLTVSRVLSGDIETGSGVSSTVGSRRFDPQNQTTRSAVAGDDSSVSDDSSDDAK